MGIGAFFNSIYAFIFGGIIGYHLYDQITLPGQPEIEFRQFSGYIDIDPDAGRSLFYYFVEAKNDALNLPLTIWLTGGSLPFNFLFLYEINNFTDRLNRKLMISSGPGCSSVGDSFVGIGPFITTDNAHGLEKNPYAWNKG